MSARGVDFLETWLDENVPFTGKPADPVLALTLAKRLVADAARARLTLADLNLDDRGAEKYIMQALAVPPDVTASTSLPPVLLPSRPFRA